MTEPWKPHFDVYEACIEDARAVFYVDLGAARTAPIRTHSLRLQVRVAMQEPRPDGLRSSHEAETLFRVEEALITDLSNARDALYVGRFVAEGYTTWFFYLPSCDYEEAPLKAVRDVSPYTLEWLTEGDPEWSSYFDFLYPDPYSLQRLMNRRQLKVRTQEGDRAELERQVDHSAFFPDEHRAHGAAAALRGLGFRVGEPSGPDDEGGAWNLEFHRPDRLDADRADELVAEILDLILPWDGEYDGWSAHILRGD